MGPPASGAKTILFRCYPSAPLWGLQCLGLRKAIQYVLRKRMLRNRMLRNRMLRNRTVPKSLLRNRSVAKSNCCEIVVLRNRTVPKSDVPKSYCCEIGFCEDLRNKRPTWGVMHHKKYLRNSNYSAQSQKLMLLAEEFDLQLQL